MFYILSSFFFTRHKMLERKVSFHGLSDLHFQLCVTWMCNFSYSPLPFFLLFHVFFSSYLPTYPPSPVRYPAVMEWIEKYFNSRFSLWSFPLLWFIAQLKMLWLNLDPNRIFHWFFISFLAFSLHFINSRSSGKPWRIFLLFSNNNDDELKRERLRDCEKRNCVI